MGGGTLSFSLKRRSVSNSEAGTSPLSQVGEKNRRRTKKGAGRRKLLFREDTRVLDKRGTGWQEKRGGEPLRDEGAKIVESHISGREKRGVVVADSLR